MTNFENREPFIKNELIEFGGYGSIISKEEFQELVDGLSTAQQKSIKNILLKMNTSERKSFIDKVKKIKEEAKKLKYQNDKKMYKLFESFKGDLNKTEKEELSNQKELFDIIKDEKLKEKIKSYINFLRNQNKSYFEINKNNEVDFIKDKEKFIKENLKDESSEIKTKFENLVASIINKKYVASYLEESGTYDKDIDKSKEKDLQEKYENFMKLENKTYDDLLALPRKVRLKLCTQKKVNIDEIRTGEVNKLTFDFRFGKNEINRDVYLNTTAGQLLPAEVKQVVKNGQVYTRSGELGEFFSKSNRRLTIHQGTNITISKYQSILETLANREIIKKELKIEDEKNISLEDSIKLEAKLRGIDPKFAIIAFKETLEKTPKEKQKYVLENMLTEFDRIRGHYRISGILDENGKYEDRLALEIFSQFGGKDWKEKAEKYGIKKEYIESEISTVSTNISMENIVDGEITQDIIDNISKIKKFKPGSKEAITLFKIACKVSGVNESWADNPHLHKIMSNESGGKVGIVNYTLKGMSQSEFKNGALNGTISDNKSASGLGQLKFSNVDRLYPSGRKGIGNPIEEAVGFIKYIRERYGDPDTAGKMWGHTGSYYNSHRGKTMRKTFKEGY